MKTLAAALAVCVLAAPFSFAAPDDPAAGLRGDRAGALVELARQQKAAAAKEERSQRVERALREVRISDRAGAGEAELGPAAPEELAALVRSLNGRKLTLKAALQSAPRGGDADLPAGFTCAASPRLIVGDEQRRILFSGPESSEWESVGLVKEGLNVEFVLGVAITKSDAKAFQVKDGKALHYRLYSRYWAKIASAAMVASSDFTNELELWKEGGRLLLKQKHRFSGHGVPDRAKECLFELR